MILTPAEAAIAFPDVGAIAAPPSTRVLVDLVLHLYAENDELRRQLYNARRRENRRHR